MEKLPQDLVEYSYELKGGLEHRCLQKKINLEINKRFLWVSSICGYQETLFPDKDFLTELLIVKKNNLRLSRDL